MFLACRSVLKRAVVDVSVERMHTLFLGWYEAAAHLLEDAARHHLRQSGAVSIDEFLAS